MRLASRLVALLVLTLSALALLPHPVRAGEGSCVAGATTLCLGDGRFRAELTWTDPRSGNSGAGQAEPLTPDTGYFWFFDKSNVEVVLKVLDGRALNGHFWIFYASLSDLGYTVTVTDTVKAETRSYENPPFTMASRGDTQAFAESPPGPSDFQSRYQRVRQEAATMTAAEFADRYRPPAALETLSYDPLGAEFLAAVRRELGLGAEQEALLAANGFVVLNDATLPTFEDAYSRIYDRDLPVLVTTDSLLYALHRSYDALLKHLELTVLVAEVEAMLDKMHAELAARVSSGQLDADQPSVRDVDVYLTVARSLLADREVPAVTGAAAGAAAGKILADAAALRPVLFRLFDQEFLYDYSQLRPRGHYEEDPVLRRYFRAMMWLGRTELRLLYQEFPDGMVLGRTAVEGAYLLNALLADAGARPHWERFNLVIERMVGEKDGMDPRELDLFRQESGLLTLAAVAATSDGELKAALEAGSYGLQRIQSQILFTGPNQEEIVLPRVYLLMSQRFVIDSYVFHNLVYDRVRSAQRRMLPDPLDVAFALGSEVAAELLGAEVVRYGYQGALHEMRFLVDSHPDDFWDANLYNGWLNALRALNGSVERQALPEAMRTRAWDHKLLATELASWAELRHDTLLYAKQSYSGSDICEYPDGYVEPYPLFYRRLAHLAEIGLDMCSELTAAGLDMAWPEAYFRTMAGIMETLEGIARKELAQEPLSEQEWHFLRATIEKEEINCGPTYWDGWYASLFFDPLEMGFCEPTIADVHTAPTDAAGNPVGWVLHAATGLTRLMVLTLPTDDGGARAYVGPVSSFHVVVGNDFTRYTDSEWEVLLTGEVGKSSRPSWDASFAR